jgi:hypothetical protein
MVKQGHINGLKADSKDDQSGLEIAGKLIEP